MITTWAILITRDGFRRREKFSGMPPTVIDICRAAKMSLRMARESPALGNVNFEKVTFVLDKMEPGAGSIVYATYKER